LYWKKTLPHPKGLPLKGKKVHKKKKEKSDFNEKQREKEKSWSMKQVGDRESQQKFVEKESALTALKKKKRRQRKTKGGSQLRSETDRRQRTRIKGQATRFRADGRKKTEQKENQPGDAAALSSSDPMPALGGHLFRE